MSTSTASTAPTLRRKKRKALSERTNSFDESLGPVDAKRRRPLPAHERLFANCGVVGSGVFGDVKLVECHQTKARFVLKVGSAGESSSRQQLQNEKRCLELLPAHAFVIRMHESTEALPSAILLEYHAQKDLYAKLRAVRRTTGSGFSPAACRFYAANLLLALRHLHAHGIVHRDLKPENCLVNSLGYLVLSDFGLAKAATEAEDKSAFCSTFVGSCTYMAPEIIFKKPYGLAADSWAFAITLFELCSGQILFNDPDQPGNLTKIFTNVLRSKTKGLPLPAGFASARPQLTDMLKNLLAFDPKHRLSCNDAANHSYIALLDLDALANQALPAPEHMVQQALPAPQLTVALAASSAPAPQSSPRQASPTSVASGGSDKQGEKGQQAKQEEKGEKDEEAKQEEKDEEAKQEEKDEEAKQEEKDEEAKQGEKGQDEEPRQERQGQEAHER